MGGGGDPVTDFNSATMDSRGSSASSESAVGAGEDTAWMQTDAHTYTHTHVRAKHERSVMGRSTPAVDAASESVGSGMKGPVRTMGYSWSIRVRKVPSSASANRRRGGEVENTGAIVTSHRLSDSHLGL